eukprot:13002-Heterococcus_DN1.PRE.1
MQLQDVGHGVRQPYSSGATAAAIAAATATARANAACSYVLLHCHTVAADTAAAPCYNYCCCCSSWH